MPHRPIMLGVVGDSAAGKTTLTAGIAAILGEERVTVVCTDDYHKYNRAQRKELGITPLHPDCNYLDILEQHLLALASGEPILKPVYDHRTGDFAPPEYVRPKTFVLVEGLLGFYSERMRDCYRVKVYLDPPELLRHRWKVSRDCAKRGYAPAEVLAELARRERDSAAHIWPQKQWADVVVSFHPPEALAPAEATSGNGLTHAPTPAEHLDVRLTLRPTLDHPDLNAVIARSGAGASAVRLSVGRDNGRLAEYFDVDGGVTAAQAAAIESAVWEQRSQLQKLLPDGSGAFVDFVDGGAPRRSHPLAITQLLIGYHLLLGRMEKEEQLRALERDVAALARAGVRPGQLSG